MKALTAAEMREVDRLTIGRHGISGLELMESAGAQAAGEVIRFFSRHARNWNSSHRVVILCGKGNNGGDGFVVAHRLRRESQKPEIRVFLFAQLKELKGDALKNAKRWRKSGGLLSQVLTEADWEKALEQVSSAYVVIDALFGTGLRGPVTGLPARAILDLNKLSGNATQPAPALILAIDMPSGLPSDGEAATGPVVRAHKTITFTAPKIGQLISPDAACCGVLHVKQIGSPPLLVEDAAKGTLCWASPEEFASLPLLRSADSHKGTFGHVLILGGSVGKSGAAVLAGYASLCSGAGLTTVACPDVTHPIITSAHPEYMTEPLPSTAEGTLRNLAEYPGHVQKILEGKTVVAIGPGLGTNPETQETIRHLVRDVTLPIILDADGLNAFAGNLQQLRERKSEFLAITPHPGEMAGLLGQTNAQVQADRVKAATEAAKRANAHVLLKGFHTVLAAPDGRIWINTTGGPALAKGGSGDVLTGVLAALTAQFGTDDWLRVLALGAYLHGEAGEATGPLDDPSGRLSSSVAMAIPIVRQKLLNRIQFGD
jgi:NAD(P)H-hydrate epimerase